MAPPFSVPPGSLVIKVEDDGQATTDQELRDMFTQDVQRRLELMRKRRDSQPAGIVQSQPPPTPPAQQALFPLPPPPPPPPTQHPCAKRPAIGPPPGFEGVRKPPPKHYQRQPPVLTAPAPQPPHHSVPPNAHRSPAPLATSTQRAAGHAPQPVSRGAAAMDAPPGPVHAVGPIVVPALQRRTVPKRKPAHPAAKKKPTVPCTFCGVLCMTARHLKQHEQGRKHRNRVAYLTGEMNVQCSVCNVHLSSGLNVEQHNAGKQHLLRLSRGA